MPQPELLIEAEKSYLEAIRRDKQNYKNYERLCGIYIFLSDVSAEPQRTEYLNKANGAESKAAELYPGLERLYFLLGQIAEQLGSKETALENYRKAIEIEQAFRENFKRLYPEHKVFSRLGEQQYNIAKQKITMLDKQENKN
jgi:tetratricopeptide (TPR) repeat protein